MLIMAILTKGAEINKSTGTLKCVIDNVYKKIV